jgi:hypothetical protein
MKTTNNQKFICVNNNITNGVGLNKFTSEFIFKNDWYQSGDYISINSVRLNDLFLADGSLTYNVAGATKQVTFNNNYFYD